MRLGSNLGQNIKIVTSKMEWFAKIVNHMESWENFCSFAIVKIINTIWRCSYAEVYSETSQTSGFWIHLYIRISPYSIYNFPNPKLYVLPQIQRVFRRRWNKWPTAGKVRKQLYTFSFTQPAFTCSKLTIGTLEKGVKYVKS